MQRVQYAVYDTREGAVAAGYPDAEYGWWTIRPGSTDGRWGWIALERRGQ